MSTEDERKLFIAGLPDSITEDVLRQLFEATGGTVVNVTLPKHRDTGRPRGFGFVTLSSAEEAASARDALDGSLQAGRAISVRPFQSEPPRRDARSEGPASQSGDRTLYVGNLPYDTSQAELEELFSANGAGPIVRVHLPAGPDGRMRGFGFITLGSADAATSAIVALRDAELRGRRLMINIAHPRGSGPDRSSAPPRRDDMGGGGGRFPPREGFDDVNAFVEPARPVEGRRWREAPAEGAAKKKKKKARGERAATSDRQRREKNKRWNDWDED
jgi:RNA recognition motif-containing protein